MRDFTTASGMQTSVTLHVFQGERPMALDNTRLGQFSLDGLPPPPRGVPKIEVTFDINADGILNVTVQDMARQRTQSIHITARLSFPPPQALTMTQAQHLEIGLAALDLLKQNRGSLHSRKLRSFDEPPFR